MLYYKQNKRKDNGNVSKFDVSIDYVIRQNVNKQKEEQDDNNIKINQEQEQNDQNK